jgi:hypothetical protein
MPVFRYRSRFPHPVEDVFAWHERPGALERLTPPWISMKILEREGGLRDGGRVVLAIKEGPAEVKWEVEHTEFREGELFRDEQRSGPFKKWIHSHRFLPGEEGGCIMEDEVEWAPPLGAAGRVFGEPFVERELERLFAFRHTRLRHDLDLHAAYDGRPLTVAVSGGTGLIGRALTHLLRTGGHEVLRISRTEGKGDVLWDYEKGKVDTEALEGVDGVIHLAGEPIFGLRWTRDKKKAIMESREKGTEVLARALAELGGKPRVLVSASGVHLYGDRGADMVTEESSPGRGFLPKVCRAWEAATIPARRAGIRVVALRTAMVLSPAGGALGTMLLPFKMGIGGRLGSGRQYVSWIDLDDHTALIHRALLDGEMRGPVNAASPHPVPNATFTDVLGRVLNRPTVVPVPSLGIKTLFGEMGETLLLDSIRAMPGKAREAGFEFRYPGLEDSLRHQLGRREEGT